jgi:hypothetical protein
MEVVVKLVVIVMVFVVPSCTDEAEPTPACIDIGCPDAPSGSPDIWTPCADPVCFCLTNRGALACTAEVQS